MLFWAVAALLTLVASLAVMLPFLRAPRGAAAAAAHDIEVYRDQLAELEREVGRGSIGRSEAEEARAEIGRRLLRAKETDGTGAAAEGASMRLVAMAAVLAVPLVSWGLYGFLGSPGLPAQPLQARLTKDPAQNSIDELIARAESHLAANPDDGRGWDVLAPVYFRLGRYADAETAYRNAIRLDGATARREAGLGEAITGERGGVVSAEAEAAFERALELEPGNPKARFFLAMAKAQEGSLDEAGEQWRSLQADLPEDSPWREAVGQALAQLDRADAGDQMAASGPSDEDVAAAAEMSPQDRKAMVEGMVARLDERLRQNPEDQEGWRRLVRSYVVLGRNEDARGALKRGVEALGQDSQGARELQAFAAGLGLAEGKEDR